MPQRYWTPGRYEDYSHDCYSQRQILHKGMEAGAVLEWQLMGIRGCDECFRWTPWGVMLTSSAFVHLCVDPVVTHTASFGQLQLVLGETAPPRRWIAWLISCSTAALSACTLRSISSRTVCRTPTMVTNRATTFFFCPQAWGSLQAANFGSSSAHAFASCSDTCTFFLKLDMCSHARKFACQSRHAKLVHVYFEEVRTRGEMDATWLMTVSDSRAESSSSLHS